MEFKANRSMLVLAAGFFIGYQQQVLYVQQIRGQGAIYSYGD